MNGVWSPRGSGGPLAPGTLPNHPLCLSHTAGDEQVKSCTAGGRTDIMSDNTTAFQGIS